MNQHSIRLQDSARDVLGERVHLYVNSRSTFAAA